MVSKFADLVPLIMRWLKRSRSNLISTVDSITILFSKTAFLNIGLSLDVEISLDSVVSDNLIREYNIKVNEIPAVKEQHKYIKSLISLFPAHTYGKKAKIRQTSNYMVKIIDILFKSLCNELKVSPKSDLRHPLSINFAKPYEIKMFIDMVCERTSLQEGSGKSSLDQMLRNGGIIGSFHAFLQKNLRRMMIRIKKYSRINVPKNKDGSFYTPSWLADFVNEKALYQYLEVNHHRPPVIADLCCGLGSFIDKFLNHSDKPILDQFGANFQLQNYIFGYDKDPFVIDIIRLNHALLGLREFEHLNIANLSVRNTLTEPPDKTFEILIGNPPWGGNLNKKTVRKMKDLNNFIDQQYDSYSLFLARNLHSLKAGGILYLVLPETLLLNPNYVKIRRHILENTTIIELIHLGEGIFNSVRMPCIILGLRKKMPEPEHEINISIIHSDKIKSQLKSGKRTLYDIVSNPEIDENKSMVSFFKRIQSSFIENHFKRLDIFTSTAEKVLLDAMKEGDHWDLKALVDNSRGVEINKKGKVIQCPTCNIWQPPPKWQIEKYSGLRFTDCNVCGNRIIFEKLRNRDRIIIDAFPDDKKELEKMMKSAPYDYILLGEHVHRYFLSGHAVIKLDYRGLKYKSEDIYKQKKIVVRKTSKKINACIDYDSQYTIQVVYQFSLNDSYRQYEFLLEYILGILNSAPMDFFYRKTHQYAYRKSFPHHLQTNILSLPIPKIDLENRKSQQYNIYLKIILDVFIITLLTESSKNANISDGLLDNIDKFKGKYRRELQGWKIDDLCFSNFGCAFEDLIKNPQIVRNPKEKIPLFEKELDDLVRKLFKD